MQTLGAAVENTLSQKQHDFPEYNRFEEALHNLIEDLSVVLKDIDADMPVQPTKREDPEAVGRLKGVLGNLKVALDSCSSTRCKRILDEYENIAFDPEIETLLQKIVNQVDDYEFSEAAETLAELETKLG